MGQSGVDGTRSWRRALGTGAAVSVVGGSLTLLCLQLVHIRALYGNLQNLDEQLSAARLMIDDSDALSRNRRQSSGNAGSCAPGDRGRNGRDGRNGVRGPSGFQGRGGPIGSPGERGPPTRGLTAEELEKVLKTVLETDGSGDRGGSDSLPPSGGVSYVRWGRAECRKGATLVYNGVVGGKHYTHAGGGSEYMCLPHRPEWGNSTAGFQSNSFMYGAEYEIGAANNLFKKDYKYYHDHDPPCAVCHVDEHAGQLMIPAWKQCPTNWTTEYSGYLMSSHHTQKTSSFVCVDSSPNVQEGSSPNQNGALWYFVEAACGSLPCPAYVSGRELTCVVCTA